MDFREDGLLPLADRVLDAFEERGSACEGFEAAKISAAAFR